MTTQTQRQNETKMSEAFAMTKKVIDRFGWGCHCAPDAYYAHIINATREYLERQPDGYQEWPKKKVEESYWKLLAVWFANAREDLQTDLLGGKTACWQDFGFPHGYVESVRDDILKSEAELATKD